jgi:hypothetical protein
MGFCPRPHALKALTTAYFIRQKDGPCCTDLEIDRIRRADGSIRVFKEGGKLCLTLGKDKMRSFFQTKRYQKSRETRRRRHKRPYKDMVTKTIQS